MSEKIRAGEAFKRLAEYDAGAKAFLARLEAAGPRLEALNRVLAILRYLRGRSLEARLDALAEEGRRLSEAEREAWKQEFGEPYPRELSDWRRWARAVQLDANRILDGDFEFVELLDLIEGELVFRKHHPRAAREAAESKRVGPDAEVWQLVSHARKALGFTRKSFDAWLREHEIPQRRPATKSGKPDPRRREVNAVAVLGAIADDSRIANDPARLARIERYRDKLRVDKRLEDASVKCLVGK